MRRVLFVTLFIAVSFQLSAKDIFEKYSKKYANPKKIEWGVSIDNAGLSKIATEKTDTTLIFKSSIGSFIYGDADYELTYYFNDKGLYSVKEKYSSGIVPKYQQTVVNIGLGKNEYFEKALGKPDYKTDIDISEILKTTWAEYKPTWLARNDRKALPGVEIKLHVSKASSIGLAIVTMTKK